MSLIERLKKRKLFQWSVAYLATAWVALQIIDVIGEQWGIPQQGVRAFHIALVIGLFVTLVLAWYHGDKGRQRVSGPEILIIAVLLAVGGLVLNLVELDDVQSPQADLSAAVDNEDLLPPSDEPDKEDDKPWIAVLSFEILTEDPILNQFAAGLNEDITNGLSEFSYLLVLSSTTSAKLASKSVDVREIGQKLGARYVLQGSLRNSGTITRITAKLVDTRNGTQIWADTFDRQLSDEKFLTIQDELTDRIVATVGDPAGEVVRTMSMAVDKKTPQEMTPYDAVLSYFLFQQRLTPEAHLISRTALENAVEKAPGYTDAWSCLSQIYQQEHMNGLNRMPNSLERAQEAAQLAIELDQTSALAHFAMAQTRYFQQNLPVFNIHAQRAIELNPRNTDTLAMIGIMMGYSGDWEKSIEMTEKAMRLNPHHAGWYFFSSFFNQYRQQNYSEALIIAQKINMPNYWATQVALVIANAQLGNREAAAEATQNLFQIWPEFEREYEQKGLVLWAYNEPDLIEQVSDGLTKAGITLSNSETENITE